VVERMGGVKMRRRGRWRGDVLSRLRLGGCGLVVVVVVRKMMVVLATKAVGCCPRL
jgi:hypothetical protein